MVINKRMYKRIWIGLTVVLISLLFISLMSGYRHISLNALMDIVLGGGKASDRFVLFEIRLPRMLIVMLAGAALSVSGALIQSVTQNDLADPSLLGISAGAGLGVAAVYLGLFDQGTWFAWGIPLAALVGGMTSAGLIYVTALKQSTHSQLSLILMGVCLSTTLSGAMVLLVSAAQREKVEFIVKWLNGSIWATSFVYVGILAGALLFLGVVSLCLGSGLDILSLGNQRAFNLGLNPESMRFLALLVAAAMASVAVAFSGSVAFIGLVGPHIARRLTGPKTVLLIVTSGFIGGILLLLADTIGRLCLSPEGLPAGLITAILGAPYLLWLMLKQTH